MPFNSTTYHANKYRREAWRQLEEARALRARVAAGEAYDWEVPRVALLAKLALGSMKIHLSYRALGALKGKQ